MLSYLSKTVSKAYKASKKALSQKPSYKQTEQYKLIRKLEKYDSQILPTNKLSQLATMSYDLDKFQLIFGILMIRLEGKELDQESSRSLKQFRNLVIICVYLVKHGASGFVDQFRDHIYVFEALYERFNLIISNSELTSKLRYYIGDISSRLKYVTELLKDKSKLLRQKQISMLIKQKLKLADKQKQNNNSSNQPDRSQPLNKIDSFLENYLWKYAGIIDGKLDQIAQIVADKFEKYLLEEIPENFEIDQLEIKEENRMKSEANFAEIQFKKEKTFLENKQQLMKKPRNEDLI